MRLFFVVRELAVPGKASKAAKRAFGKRVGTYEALRKHGMSKAMSAAIANAGRTRAGRSRMARKAARTRAKRRG